MKKLLSAIILIIISSTIFSQNENELLIKELIASPVFINDTIMVRDSSISYRFNGTDSIPFYKLINTAFNNSGMPEEIFYYSYNTNNQQFEPNTKVTIKYFDNSSITEETHRYEYNSADGSWHLVNHNLYNKHSNELLREYYGYDISYTSFIAGSKTTFEYNEQKYLLSIYAEKIDINSQTLVNDRKIEYQRDENNNDTAVLHYEWLNDLWEVQTKTFKNYNGNQLSEEINYVPGDNTWNWTDKIIHTYSSDGSVDTSTYYNWYEEYEFWYIERQRVSKIIDEKIPVFVILRNYDFVTETWSSTDKTSWIYENNILVNMMEESWIDDEWKPIHEVNYYYNSDEYIDSTISKYFNTFDTTYFSLENDYFNYNSDNTIFSIMHFSKHQQQDFTKTYTTYFYNSPFVTPDAIKEIASLKLKLYPNPAWQSINISSDIELRKLSIYNIQGQKILSQDIDYYKNTNINISSLKSGLYLINAESETKFQTIRFIKQ